MRIDKNSKLTHKGGYLAAARSVESPSTEQTGHTPTPWETKGMTIVESPRGVIAIIPLPQAGGVFECSHNLKFIVRAVNSHSALLEAAKWMLSLFDDEGNFREEYQDQASVAMEKTEAAIKQATQTLHD